MFRRWRLFPILVWGAYILASPMDLPAQNSALDPFSQADHDALSELGKTLKGDALWRARLDFYEKKLAELSDPNHIAAVKCRMWVSYVALGRDEDALGKAREVYEDERVDDYWKGWARAITLKVYSRQIKHAETEEEFLEFQAKASEAAETFLKETKEQAPTGDALLDSDRARSRILKEADAISMPKLREKHYSPDGKFISPSEREAAARAKAHQVATPPPLAAPVTMLAAATVQNDSQEEAAEPTPVPPIPWPIRHTLEIRDLATSLSINLAEVDANIADRSPVMNRNDFIIEYGKYLKLRRVYAEARQRELENRVEKAFVDFLWERIQLIDGKTLEFLRGVADACSETNPDLSHEVLSHFLRVLKQYDPVKYLDTLEEWNLRDFGSFREYHKYFLMEFDSVFPQYLGFLSDTVSFHYSRPKDTPAGKPDFVRVYCERFLEEAATWETKYDWAASLPETEKDRIRHTIAFCAPGIYRGLGDWYYEHSEPDKALDYYRKALARVADYAAAYPTRVASRSPLQERHAAQIEQRIAALSRLQVDSQPTKQH